MTETAYETFLKTIADENLTEPRMFAALEELARSIVGVKMFTVTTDDETRLMSKRLHSSRPDVYPVHGLKPYELNKWTEIVTDGKQTFVANDIETIATVFHDADVMKSVGCEAIINVPVVLQGRVVATLNCSNAAGYYTEEKVQASEALKLPGAICMLLHEKFNAERAA